MDDLAGGVAVEVGGAAAGGAAIVSASTRARPLANSEPSGPAHLDGVVGRKLPVTSVTPAGSSDRPCVDQRLHGAVVDGTVPLEATAKAIHSLRAGSRRGARAARRCRRRPPGDRVDEHVRPRRAAAITARTPDHAAILAAASLDAMPPLPRALPGAAGDGLERRGRPRRSPR